MIRITYPDADTKRLMNLAEFKRAEKVAPLDQISHHEVHMALRELRAEDTEYAAWYHDFTHHRQKTLEMFRKSKSQTWSHFKVNYEGMK